MAASDTTLTEPSVVSSATTIRKTSGSLTSVILLCLIPLATLATGWFLRPTWAWVSIMALLATFIVLIGKHSLKLYRGAFIDPRNKISLSRLQTILWTILVVAAYLSIAIYNIRVGASDPLDIAIPEQLWALLGISLTALVGSALIKGQQTTKERANVNQAAKNMDEQVSPEPGTKALVRADDPNKPVVAVGVLTVNATPEQSSWSDMFRAEQVGAADHLDLGKIQMFYFTIIIVFSYAMAIARMLAQASGRIGDFPTLDNSIVALLGISSAAYLTGKGISSTDTDDTIPTHNPAAPQTDSSDSRKESGDAMK